MQYSGMACVYDSLMVDVAYGEWAAYIRTLLEKREITGGLLLEYACGTGNITVPLARAGYEVIAVDRSEEMLNEARAKVRACAADAQFVCEDMTRLKVNRRADAAVCACDGVNYLLTEEAVREFFSNAFLNIRPDGVFLFDISSAVKIREELGNEFFYDDGENRTLFWQNEYDARTKQVCMELTLFIKEGQAYRRVDELHRQRAWEQDEITKMLAYAGFSQIEVFDFLTERQPGENARRLQFCAVKKERT
ncbi:MAG TPA: hypothetical protein DEB31_11240 [Clostridiales bacterium]|nr:hypothetical protein [Clostridiales bacterium]